MNWCSIGSCLPMVACRLQDVHDINILYIIYMYIYIIHAHSAGDRLPGGDAIPVVFFVILAQQMKCPVCLGEYSEGDHIHVLPCKHDFHPGCILPWLQKVSNTLLYYIFSDMETVCSSWVLRGTCIVLHRHNIMLYLQVNTFHILMLKTSYFSSRYPIFID